MGERQYQFLTFKLLRRVGKTDDGIKKKNSIIDYNLGLIVTLTTMMLVYIFTKKITLSLGIGIIQVIIKMIVYFLPECLWLRIKLGFINR